MYMHSKYKFTVFTSCYNSEKFIRRLYSSLKKQKFMNFEWLVVDDFSQDGTKKILESLKKEAPFDMRILYNTSNEMISFCCNLGVKNAQGQFFIFLDHDDELLPHSLERFNEVWENIKSDKKPKLAGMMSNCMDQYGNFVTDELPNSPCITDYYSMYYDMEVKGEKFFCYLTKVLQENNFSTVDRYVPENVLLLNISDSYDTYFFNENLRIYHINQENHMSLINKLADGWKIKFPIGMRYAKLQDLNRRSRKMLKNPGLFFKTIVNYARFSFHADIPIHKSLSEINSTTLKILIIIFIPIAKLLSIKDSYLN